jgi:uncharacterized protein (DUF1800 family)
MVKPPIVYIAGMHRARGLGVKGSRWSSISEMAGQRPFRPPNVSGWDEERWLDTSSYRGRWTAAAYISRDDQVTPGGYSATETASEAVDNALHYWGDPVIDSVTRAGLEAFSKEVELAITASSQNARFRGMRQNALRMMVAVSPRMQTS